MLELLKVIQVHIGVFWGDVLHRMVVLMRPWNSHSPIALEVYPRRSNNIGLMLFLYGIHLGRLNILLPLRIWLAFIGDVVD